GPTSRLHPTDSYLGGRYDAATARTPEPPLRKESEPSVCGAAWLLRCDAGRAWAPSAEPRQLGCSAVVGAVPPKVLALGKDLVDLRHAPIERAPRLAHYIALSVRPRDRRL